MRKYVLGAYCKCSVLLLKCIYMYISSRSVLPEVFQDHFVRVRKSKHYSNYSRCMFPKDQVNKKHNQTIERKMRKKGIHTPTSFSGQCKDTLDGRCGKYFDGAHEIECFEAIYGLKYPTQALIKEDKEIFSKYLQILPQFFHMTERKVLQFIGSYTRSIVRKQLPREKNKLFTKHEKCMRRVAKLPLSRTCLPKLVNTCRKSTVMAAKVIRMRMQSLQKVLERDPYIKVLHLIRDPRGVVLSRAKANRTEKMLSGGSELCEKITQDILEREGLEKTYKNTFKVVRYEDLATRPLDTASDVYEFLGLSLPQSVKDWLTRSTANSKAKEHSMSTRRKNSTLTAQRWKSEPSVPREQLAKKCRFVLEKLNYEA